MPSETPKSNIPERERFIDDMASVFSRGYTLTSTDVNQILPRYGYSSARTFGGLLKGKYPMHDEFALRGIKVAVKKYKSYPIYSDGNLKAAQTDIADSRKRVDKRLAEISRIKRATNTRKREETWYLRNEAGFMDNAVKEAAKAGVEAVGWE